MKLEKFRPIAIVLAWALSVTTLDLAHGQVGLRKAGQSRYGRAKGIACAAP